MNWQRYNNLNEAQQHRLAEIASQHLVLAVEFASLDTTPERKSAIWQEIEALRVERVEIIEEVE